MLDHARVSVVSVRAPLRISLGGGGTDLPSHFHRHGGLVVSAAIDRRVRVRIEALGTDRYRLSHLEEEECDHPSQIRHPILRAAILRHGDGRSLELSSEGDVPPGTGLGSSGAYAVCVVRALELGHGRDLASAELAEAACAIELDDLGRTVGRQDQYAAAFGGVNAFGFAEDDSVEVRSLSLPDRSRQALEDNFLLFFTGQSRSAAEVLGEQVRRALAGDAELDANLRRTHQLAAACASALEAGDLEALAALMEENWKLKRGRLPGIVTPRFEELRGLALEAGARAAVLTGAGAGGYLLAYVPDPQALRAAMTRAGAPELPFALDVEGCVAE